MCLVTSIEAAEDVVQAHTHSDLTTSVVDHGYRRCNYPRRSWVGAWSTRTKTLLLLNLTGRRPIIQSGFRSCSPAYPLLHIDALNHALEKAARPGDVDPVLYVSSLDPATPSACCHVKHGELSFLSPVSGDST